MKQYLQRRDFKTGRAIPKLQMSSEGQCADPPSTTQPMVDSFIMDNVPPSEEPVLTESTESQEGYEVVPPYNMAEYTLTQLDQIIQKRLLARIRNIDHLYDQLEVAPLSSKLSLRTQIRDIQSGFEYLYYIISSQHIINDYLLLTRTMATSSFIQTTSTQKTHQENHGRVQELLVSFASLAKYFIPIDYKPSRTGPILKCTQCQYSILQCINSLENIYVCQQCFAEIYIQSNQKPIFKDIDRINFTTKHPYSRLNHIREAVNCFQGLEPIPQKIDIIMEVIRRQCDFYKLSVDASDPNCITRLDIYSFLEQERSHDSSKGLSDYYKDVNLLHRLLTGVPCPDITDYLDQVYTDFVIQEQMYDSMDHGHRKNSLNVYYKLYKLLQRQNAPYTAKDFFLLKTQDVLDQHDAETRKVWDQLGWEWIDTV